MYTHSYTIFKTTIIASPGVLGFWGFGGLKIDSFRASCFDFRVKGVCPLLLHLVSLLQTICNQWKSCDCTTVKEKQIWAS